MENTTDHGADCIVEDGNNAPLTFRSRVPWAPTLDWEPGGGVQFFPLSPMCHDLWPGHRIVFLYIMIQVLTCVLSF